MVKRNWTNENLKFASVPISCVIVQRIEPPVIENDAGDGINPLLPFTRFTHWLMITTSLSPLMVSTFMVYSSNPESL